MLTKMRNYVCFLLAFYCFTCPPNCALAAGEPKPDARREVLDYLATFPTADNSGLLAAGPFGSYSIQNEKGKRVGAFVKSKYGTEEYQFNPDGSIRRWQKIDLKDKKAVLHEKDEQGQGVKQRLTEFGRKDGEIKYRETFYGQGGEYSHEYTKGPILVEKRVFNRRDELVYKKRWSDDTLWVYIYTDVGKRVFLVQTWNYIPNRVDKDGHPAPFRLNFSFEYDKQEELIRQLNFHGDGENLKSVYRYSSGENLEFDRDGTCVLYATADKQGNVTRNPTAGIKPSDEPNYEQLRTDPEKQ